MIKRLLSIESLSLNIQGRYLLRDVSFAMDSGDSLGLIGESGSGKTLTAKAILGLLPAHLKKEGRIFFDGSATINPGKDVGLVLQNPMTSLNPTLTTGRQMVETIRYHAGVSRSQARERALHFLHQVGISSPSLRFSQLPHELSGGMRQRVMLALAMAPEPKLLIADEPTTALDASTQVQILDLIQQVCRETECGLLLISHDLHVVSYVCRHVAVMNQGLLVEQGLTENVLNSPSHPYTRYLLEQQ